MNKIELWTQRIADWQASGLSQRAFCQQHGLAISTFHNWRHKLQNNDPSLQAPTSAFLPVVIQNESNHDSSTISVNTNELAFDCSISQLAQLITELNQHA